VTVLLAQLSDPHVDVADGAGGSVQALAAAVRAVLALRPLPDAVLVSGDLVQHGDPQAYARVRELLAPLPMAVHVLPGNHDDRDAMRACFDEAGAAGAPGGPFRYAVRCGDARLIACDTTQPGRVDGRLDAEALAWLDEQLAAEPAAPAIVAMHHAPLLTGITAFDDLGLPAADRAALGELLARRPQARRVVAGHVHRAVAGVLGGCAVVACPSTDLQARLEIGADELVLEPAPAAFALHVVLDDGEVLSHVQPIVG
jgi:3',5'-cyclic AMP phosphodiesterase CpdA